MKLWIAMWLVTCFGTTMIVIVIELQIRASIRSQVDTLTHGSTKRMHSDFHRALLAMVGLTL